MMRWKFAREFKKEAVNPETERGISFAPAAHDLDLHLTVHGRRAGDYDKRARGGFPEQDLLTSRHEVIHRLTRDNAKFKAERDISKMQRSLYWFLQNA